MGNRPLKFLVYGAGAIGSIFAGKLSGAGFDVTMLARGKRYEYIKTKGIILENALNGRRESYNVKVIKELKDDDIYDFILVVMQKTQVDEVLPLLSKNKSSNVVFIVNNPSGYEKWVNCIGRSRVMIGFPSAGGERVDEIVRYFIGTGIFKVFQSTTFGEIDGIESQRLLNLLKAFKMAGFSPSQCRNMEAWQKCHVAVVSPIANAIYKFNGDNYALSRSSSSLKLMIKATREGFDVLKKIGVPVTPVKLNFYYLPYCLLIPVFKIAIGSRVGETAMSKHANIAKAEMKQLEAEFRVFIEKSGMPVEAIDELAKFNY